VVGRIAGSAQLNTQLQIKGRNGIVRHFLPEKKNEHESYDMDEDDFCRRPVKQCGDSSRGSGTQAGVGTLFQGETIGVRRP
jgi:hypothetical protein